jgi:hypothetical protein
MVSSRLCDRYLACVTYNNSTTASPTSNLKLLAVPSTPKWTQIVWALGSVRSARPRNACCTYSAETSKTWILSARYQLLRRLQSEIDEAMQLSKECGLSGVYLVCAPCAAAARITSCRMTTVMISVNSATAEISQAKGRRPYW